MWLKETPTERLVAPGYPLGWLLAVMQKAERPGAELEGALGEALEHLRGMAGEQREALGKLLRFLVMLLCYRRELEEARALAERVDAVAREAKVSEMGRTAWQELLEEGRKEGVERGLREGAERGLREGAERGRQQGLEALRETLLDVLTDRFGDVPADVIERVQATREPQRLRQLIHEAGRAESLDALSL